MRRSRTKAIGPDAKPRGELTGEVIGREPGDVRQRLKAHRVGAARLGERPRPLERIGDQFAVNAVVRIAEAWTHGLWMS